jgi:hypothetical protein
LGCYASGEALSYTKKNILGENKKKFLIREGEVLEADLRGEG